MSEPQGARICPHCGSPCEDAEVRFCGRCGTDVRRVTDPALSTTSPSGTHAFGEGEDPMLGRVVDGRYRVQARIGQGGMGVVYRVEHVAMGKVAALKMLHPSLSQEAEVVRRFRREAEAVSRLSHPNSVQVFDFGQADGSMYLVMELVRGEDLGALLRRDGPLVWRRLAPILAQVLDALSEAHELGVIHRDLKPENLLVSRTRDGRDLVKVLDFGLAKLRDVEELNQVTGRGTVIGTPYYMSPEQIRAEDLDARSDLYSLGAVAYRALTGEHPFSAATPVAVLTQHLTAKLMPPRDRAPSRDIPAVAEEIVLRAMQREPADRYQSAEAMRMAIDEVTNASPARGTTPDATRRESDAQLSPAGVALERLRREDFDGYERGLRLRRYLALSLVPLILVLAAGAAFYAIRHQQPGVRDEEVEPNDDPATANAIVSGQPIRGHIGKRRSQEESDRDFFHISVRAPDDRLTAEVSGIPEMDLILQVFDGAGHEIAESETGAEGDAEEIFDLRVAPGDYYVQAREVWVSGENATENVSDWYSLKAIVDRSRANEELEPNGDPTSANPVAPAGPMVGRLTHPGDVDCYALGGPVPATIAANVSSLQGVDLRLTLLPRTGKLGGKGLGVRVADSARTGEGVRLDKASWPATAGAPVLCVERRDHPVARGREHAAHTEHSPHVALPSRSATYSLTIDAAR